MNEKTIQERSETAYYAHSHPDFPDDRSKWQPLDRHLRKVAERARQASSKVGLPEMGELMGLLHDIGKHSTAFQEYMTQVTGGHAFNEDEAAEVVARKGKVDHSSSGGQFVWRHMQGQDPIRRLAAQMMALCVVSHHSGLIDCISPDGNAAFSLRMEKSSERTHVDEVRRKVSQEIRGQMAELLGGSRIQISLSKALRTLLGQRRSVETGELAIGLLVRLLFSALIDADRLDAADAGGRAQSLACTNGRPPDWGALVKRLEDHLARLPLSADIDSIRASTSQECRRSALRERGLFSLTVPTGGGKTLSSLRFAMHHAAHHRMDRIIYVIPYTSIIDQNAAVVRSILEVNCVSSSDGWPIVLEHHSNLTPERDTWQSKIVAENWDAPIVFTTAVQFLETLFGAGTRGARRMHQLANAVIIFDEIQTIPIKTVHLFNNAVNFLVSLCGATGVLCTATQPLLDKVDYTKGAIEFSPHHEIMPDVKGQFRALRRVEICDERKIGGWSADELGERAREEMKRGGSVLVIVNTKAAARAIYRVCRQRHRDVFHLSTNMCPAHRKAVLRKVKQRLDGAKSKPLVCVSTQLIEAGVDIDFGCVIRHLAGLDSIAQAAGRCNRHGLRETGRVFIVNPACERLDHLPEIRIASEVAARVLDEYKRSPDDFEHDLIGPEAISLFYRYYFYERASEMAFPVSGGEIGRDDTLLSLLSTNALSVDAYKRNHNNRAPDLNLRQAFRTAAVAFHAIDAPTEGVIVPYATKGPQIIGELCAAFEAARRRDLLKQAQGYAVNVFPYALRRLREADCVHEVQEGAGIMYLDDRYYSREFGLSWENVTQLRTLLG